MSAAKKRTTSEAHALSRTGHESHEQQEHVHVGFAMDDRQLAGLNSVQVHG